MGAIDFHVVPTSGPVSGLSFEDQVTAAFNELGQEISDIETASSSATETANEAKALAESAVDSVQAAVIAAGEATVAAAQAQNAATGATAAAAEATSRANTAIDNAAQAQTAANTANGIAQGAVTTANNAQSSASSAVDTANSAAQTAQIALNKINTISVATPVGMIDLLPFRPDEFPSGWYFCNGDNYALSSAQGTALDNLSANFKADWNITVSGANISLPNMFYSDGRGYYLRAIDGANRQVGSIGLDQIKAHTHETDVPTTAYGAGTNAFSSGSRAGLGSGHPSGSTGGLETSVLDRGMTPAIYLGV